MSAPAYPAEHLADRIRAAGRVLRRGAQRRRLTAVLTERERELVWRAHAVTAEDSPLDSDVLACLALLLEWWALYCEQAQRDARARLPRLLRWRQYAGLLDAAGRATYRAAIHFDDFADWQQWAELVGWELPESFDSEVSADRTYIDHTSEEGE